MSLHFLSHHHSLSHHCLSPGTTTRSLNWSPSFNSPPPSTLFKVVSHRQHSGEFVQYQKLDLQPWPEIFQSFYWGNLGLGYHVTLMEERAQLRPKTIFRCFARATRMSSMVTTHIAPPPIHHTVYKGKINFVFSRVPRNSFSLRPWRSRAAWGWGMGGWRDSLISVLKPKRWGFCTHQPTRDLYLLRNQ